MSFFFRFSLFSIVLLFSRHFFFFDKEEDKEDKEDKEEDDFQLGRIDGVLPVRVLVPGTF